MIVGIDHGYYAIKTKHVSFPSGIIEYDYEPYTMQNVTIHFHIKSSLAVLSATDTPEIPVSPFQSWTKAAQQPE